jgi:hypothetical protein
MSSFTGNLDRLQVDIDFGTRGWYFKSTPFMCMLALRGWNYETTKLDETRSIKRGFEGSKRFNFEAAQSGEGRELLFPLPFNEKAERYREKLWGDVSYISVQVSPARKHPL